MVKLEGKKTSLARIIHNVNYVNWNLGMLLQLRKGRVTCTNIWPEMIKELERYCSKLKVKKFLWEFPPEGLYKYNIDGASRGNPSVSSYAFCLRDDEGDIIYAEGATMENTTIQLRRPEQF